MQLVTPAASLNANSLCAGSYVALSRARSLAGLHVLDMVQRG